MKNLIKRVQSRACSSFAERKNFGPLAKQKVFSIVTLLLMAVTAHAEEVTGVTYLYYADQAAAIAQTPSNGTADCTKVEASDTEVTWNSGWYVVNEDVTISARIDVVGEVNLILADGATLTSTVCINTNGAILNIYGQTLGTGTLNATGSNGNAGIGGKGTEDAGTLTINGGKIIAKGGVYQNRAGGAGIGGGCAYYAQTGGSGGTITINGGTVTATGALSAAGIGGGSQSSATYDDGSCGNITINGGTVTATGGDMGVGIGCGSNGNGGTITINGGNVVCTGGTRSAGIGCGSSSSKSTIIPTITITGGSVTATGKNPAAGIGGGKVTAGNITITGGTVKAYAEPSSIYPAGSGIGLGYNSTGTYQTTFTLSLGNAVRVKAANKGATTAWVDLPEVERESFLTDHSMRRVYIVTPQILDEIADNASWLTENDGETYTVTLTRTLQTGGWNTFCAPFSTATPSGWTVKELTGSDFNSSTGELTLNFGNAASIEAGKPYLVKVSEKVTNPTFWDVTVSNTTTTTETTAADFVPVVNPTNLTGGDKTVLFIIGGNKLTYPENDGNINGFRAYFQLKGDAASLARAFRMSLDDDVTGIVTVLSDEPTTVIGTYTLDGRRIEGQPTQKGVYIVNGKKTIIK